VITVDFALNDDQELLRDSTRTLLERECPASLLRAHMLDASAADPLWDHLRGFTELGGGLLADLHLFLEETGYVAAPGPFFATAALFAPLLGALDHELLPAVLAGEVTGTVALAGADGRWSVNDEPVKTFVPEADRVDWVAVVSAGPCVTVAPRLPVRHVETIDSTRRLFEVDATGLPGEATSVHPGVLDDVLVRATVALAAEMVGTARRLFDMTLAHAKERVQFDVPIGSFQAIQHTLADLALEVERATSAAQYSAMTVDAGHPDRRRAAHVAKAAAGAAVTRAARDGIQIHGGIGYTWEHDLHLFIRRAYASEHWLGTRTEHHDRLAELLI